MIGLVDGNNFFVSCERVIDPSLNGRAVAVLSNNDGCCVSRSNEFKALGIPMGTPYFQLKNRERSGEVVFRSSNYELYGDLSQRIISILRDEAVSVEQYSIDEAFLVPPTCVIPEGLLAYAKRLRAKILKWVGIPCGVGFAKTKTLAKIANHIAKKSPEGVFVFPEDGEAILSQLPIEEIWGIGRRMALRLHSHGIHTAEQFRKSNDTALRAIGSVQTVRTAMELRGIPCVEEDQDADPDSVSCSRSFGEPVVTEIALFESIASFIAKAACKLRRHHLVASGCTIYAQFGNALDHQYAVRTVSFPIATDATHQMLEAVRKECSKLYLKGVSYRKSGVVFFGLERASAPRQGDLFSTMVVSTGLSKLYQTIDSLNARLGSRTVFSAAEGVATIPKWQMKREKLSPRATTNWNELIRVH